MLSNQVFMDKKSLRKRMKTVRADVGGNATQVMEKFLSLAEVTAGKSFLVYNAFGTEAPTMPLIESLVAADKRVYLPRVENTDMVAVEYKKDTTFTRSAYGILEPIGRANQGLIDVAVIPLLAVDETGARLGYGGGFYDRFLRDRNILKIAYCYDCQVVDKLPAEPHDIKMDIIVTDKQIIKIKG